MENKNITVIGIGKLGLGFALLLEKAGYNVLGVDIFPEYVENINKKTLNFAEPGYNDLLQTAKNFQATTSLSDGLAHSDIIFMLVQTPNGGGTKFYDHTILSNLLERINKQKPQNKHFIIGCTVMPHYIDEIATTLLSDAQNCSISYNPEFIAQGEIVKGFLNPDMILVGTNVPSILTPILKEIYDKMTENTPIYSFMTPLEAEIVKISLNGFITTKISFANMISDLCDQVGANKHAVLTAIGSDTRIGRKYFNPGLSFGGPCFPRDTRALKQLMDQHTIQSDILQATTKYNNEHNQKFAENLVSKNTTLKQKTMKTLECSEHYDDNTNDTFFKFTKVCYKPDSTIPIIEESAKLKIAEILVNKYGKKVTIEDIEPLIQEVKKEYGSLFSYVVRSS
jgi:nucleotide sugar dehydrogenase